VAALRVGSPPTSFTNANGAQKIPAGIAPAVSAENIRDDPINNPARRASAISTAYAGCSHQPRCPQADDPSAGTARVAVARPEQGWSLLCNAVILFTDGGALLPDGSVLRPPEARRTVHRPPEPTYDLRGAR
jgi:hypothetical protein